MARIISRVSIGGIGITFVVSWPGKPGSTQFESRFHGSQTMVESFLIPNSFPVKHGGETWMNLQNFAETCAERY